MIRLRVASMMVAVALVAGCTPSQAEVAGLPGPVPDDVRFRAPDDVSVPAPRFELDLLSGERLDTDDQWAVRPMVLLFFESWCERCREQQPAINELVDEYEDIVLFVGVANLSPEEDVREYVRDNDVRYPVGIDEGGEVWLKYAAQEPPLVALIAKDGHLVRGWAGGQDGDVLREHIADLLVESTG